LRWGLTLAQQDHIQLAQGIHGLSVQQALFVWVFVPSDVSISKDGMLDGTPANFASAESPVKIADPRDSTKVAGDGGAGSRDQPWTNGPRGEVVARFAADLAALAKVGDFNGARIIHEAIERLLRG